jgi:hypothetical protein
LQERKPVERGREVGYLLTSRQAGKPTAGQAAQTQTSRRSASRFATTQRRHCSASRAPWYAALCAVRRRHTAAAADDDDDRDTTSSNNNRRVGDGSRRWVPTWRRFRTLACCRLEQRLTGGPRRWGGSSSRVQQSSSRVQQSSSRAGRRSFDFNN